jgi:C-terminal novel E3 ligase, LRR-interacting/Leucine rich repeat
MISSIKNYVVASFNNLVNNAKKLNPLNLRIKEYVIHKFEDIAACFKNIPFLGNKKFNLSNQNSINQSSNRKVNQKVDQSLNLDILSQALKAWENDLNATGNKQEASKRIRQVFQNKSIFLDLSILQLNNLPKIIGQLTQLQTLYLYNNKLQALPAEIVQLTQLKTLSLSSNQLKALPAEIIQLTQLQTLDLSYNQLQALPTEIGQLTQLQRLDLYNNKLQALPAEIGQLTQLQRLSFSGNPNLRELPLSLGELSQLSFIDIDRTQISPEVCESILAQCQAKRKEQDPFSPRLQKWFTIAGMKDVNLEVFKAWASSHQETTKEWLFRLEKTQDYQGNQRKLSEVVCNMLRSVAEDEGFKALFMSQAEANNTACQDRSAMGLNELYTTWQIYLMEKNQTISLQDKLHLSIKAAKTLALRGYLTDIISKREKQNHQLENESVEIFLYYETSLKKELNLLSVIEKMSYSVIGKRDWIDINQLKKEVNDQYITHLVEIPAFMSMAKQDQSFKEQLDLIDAESHKKVKELGNCPVNDEWSEEVLDWKVKNGEINEQHQQSRIQMVKKWLEEQKIS